MRNSTIALRGVIRGTTAEAVDAVRTAFGKAHAFILDARMLGGVAVVFQWEMEGDHRPALERALADANILLDEASIGALRSPGRAEAQGSFHVTLVNDSPDKKGTVPAVPG